MDRRPSGFWIEGAFGAKQHLGLFLQQGRGWPYEELIWSKTWKGGRMRAVLEAAVRRFDVEQDVERWPYEGCAGGIRTKDAILVIPWDMSGF